MGNEGRVISMPMNGYWLRKYGKQPQDMDDGERWMAMFNEIYEIRDEIKCIPKHEKLFYVIVLVGPFLISAIVWLVLQVLNNGA
uniref:Uncharacterized protein n=1 Tax=viral metagenome TaxID=1070528 RepID=A0A6M3J1X8_9ZZZZ